MAQREPRYIPAVFGCELGRAGDTGWARLSGELDVDSVERLERALAQLRADGCCRIVADLSALTFMDSSGLRILMRWHLEAEEGAFAFAIVPGGRQVQRLFALTGNRERFTTVDPQALGGRTGA